MPIDWPRLVEIIHRHERFVLTSHIRPDCDALGSELGLAGVLESLGKQVRIVNGQATPPNLKFIDPAGKLKALGVYVQPADLNDAEVLIVLDTSAWAQLGPMADVVRSSRALKLIIDHHVGEDDLGAELFKDVTAEATGRLIFQLAEQLEVKLTPTIAAPLFAAVATDTGWLRFGSTTGETFRVDQPNDIAVRSDGTIYFTDPYYGDGTTDLDFHGVFRIAPDGSLTAEYRGALTEQPNGIALSPDESLLYVADMAANLVWVFDVAADGSLSEPETFVTTGDGPDGMTVDNAGNLFVATYEGIEVFAPDGARWGVIPVSQWAHNCAFGGDDGRTLYITAEPELYRVTLANPGPSAPPGSGQDAAPPTSG